jgi:hypothetical protein
MSVYVDDMDAEFGRMKMSHMWADTHEELITMANKIGVALKWIQYPGHPIKEHFDIALSKKKLALENGAIQKTWRDYGLWGRAKRKELEGLDVILNNTDVVRRKECPERLIS